MTRSSLLCCLMFAALLGGPDRGYSRAQAPTNDPLTLQGIADRWRSGAYSEDVLITIIRKNGKAFNPTPDEMDALKSIGISETVIKYLVDPSLPYSTPTPPAPIQPPVNQPDSPVRPSSPPRHYPPDEHAAQVPPEPGLYRFSGNSFLKTDLKTLLGQVEAPGLTKAIGKKGKVTGYLLGKAAKTTIQDTLPALYIRLPEGKAIDEIVLVSLTQNKDRREVELGSTPDKLQLKADSMRPFDSLEVGPRVVRININDKLKKGEYIFLLMGSAEPPKGNYGKVYDFGIEGTRK